MMDNGHVGGTSEFAVRVEDATNGVTRETEAQRHEPKGEITRLREMLLLAHADFSLFHPGAVCESHCSGTA